MSPLFPTIFIESLSLSESKAPVKVIPSDSKFIFSQLSIWQGEYVFISMKLSS